MLVPNHEVPSGMLVKLFSLLSACTIMLQLHYIVISYVTFLHVELFTGNVAKKLS